MSSYVLDLQEIDKTKLVMVGGKGANLGELSRIEGLQVPVGFCVTTEAYKETIGSSEEFDSLLNQLSLLRADNREGIGKISARIRDVIEGIAIPKGIDKEITHHLAQLGEFSAYAVRSSATAEDLPTASFAGQHDTYLNVIGKEAILEHISKCWASLFTERAVIYRHEYGFDHRKVHLAVVVQRMVFPQAAGVLFTADPVTSDRKVLSIDAGFGLGQALVSGRVNADLYKVRNGRIIDKNIAVKKLAVYASKDGGTEEHEIEPERQKRQTLTDEQVLRLERMGRKIEEHFGRPQDIEWCLADDTFHIVQSRPITTLFPIPEANDQENHVYVSVGHQQMMTDPMKPLGLSIFQLTSAGPRFRAAGRLFVDVTQMLASPHSREMLLDTMGQHDPLIRDALMTVIERDFIELLPDDKKEPSPIKSKKGMPPAKSQAQIEDDPTIVSDLIRASQASIEKLRQDIQTKSGSDLFDFIMEDIQQLKKTLFDPHSSRVYMSAMDASSWINRKMNEWLGEKNAADTLSRSVPDDITAEMGLELLDVADVIRPYPEVIDYLQHAEDDDFLDELVRINGGQEAREAIHAFLNKYGMRCAGEIDITKTRWSEKPTILIPLILSNIENYEPDTGKRRFEQGRQAALEKEQELLDRLKQLPDGEQKAGETGRMISLFRNFIGYREYPKYDIINRYFIYKQALLKEAEKLVQAKVIHEKEDIYYLTLEELREVVRTNRLDYDIIRKRKEEYAVYEKLMPPRVMTSEGEVLSGTYKLDSIPRGALPGIPASSGTVEGRARIILRMEDADIEEDDILVTTFTDPGWTPVFVSIKGLVTEVGGMMTHGAVVAREYGLPTVIGVENATGLIKNGQRIRVNGTEGYVEIL